MTPTEQKIESYRPQYKKTNKQFDALVRSFQSPDHAASYLRGFLNANVR